MGGAVIGNGVAVDRDDRAGLVHRLGQRRRGAASEVRVTAVGGGDRVGADRQRRGGERRHPAAVQRPGADLGAVGGERDRGGKRHVLSVHRRLGRGGDRRGGGRLADGLGERRRGTGPEEGVAGVGGG